VCTSPLSHIYLGTHVFSPQVFELGRCMLGMGVAARVHVTFESYISWDFNHGLVNCPICYYDGSCLSWLSYD
jgi:hypothetical protein